MKSRVTERERVRVVGSDGEKSGGRGWYMQWQGKRKGGGERESTNRIREMVWQQTDFFSLTGSHRLSLVSQCKLWDDIKPELKQEGTFISLLSPNRPPPSLFEESFTPTHIKDGVYLFFRKQGEKGKTEGMGSGGLKSSSFMSVYLYWEKRENRGARPWWLLWFPWQRLD